MMPIRAGAHLSSQSLITLVATGLSLHSPTLPHPTHPPQVLGMTKMTQRLFSPWNSSGLLTLCASVAFSIVRIVTAHLTNSSMTSVLVLTPLSRSMLRLRELLLLLKQTLRDRRDCLRSVGSIVVICAFKVLEWELAVSGVEVGRVVDFGGREMRSWRWLSVCLMGRGMLLRLPSTLTSGLSSPRSTFLASAFESIVTIVPSSLPQLFTAITTKITFLPLPDALTLHVFFPVLFLYPPSTHNHYVDFRIPVYLSR
ncbi:hypothetical protein DL96DRAFT_1585099 [Flagelloscypha sp. PMI_526]|nr:hypothetical protein DL96DRAFT_1585099 [Flagelloscypha sp. PMI_526]